MQSIFTARIGPFDVVKVWSGIADVFEVWVSNLGPRDEWRNMESAVSPELVVIKSYPSATSCDITDIISCGHWSMHTDRDGYNEDARRKGRDVG